MKGTKDKKQRKPTKGQKIKEVRFLFALLVLILRSDLLLGFRALLLCAAPFAMILFFCHLIALLLCCDPLF